MKKQEQQNKEWEENYYPDMPGNFFEQKIPNEPCRGCRKRDELIEKQKEYIAFIGNLYDNAMLFCYTHGIMATKDEVKKGKKLRKEIEQLKKEMI
jgi:hypothetical protein